MAAATPLRIELRAGEVLFREGDPPTTGFLLESGEIEIAIRIDGQPIVLSRLRAGDILGEMGVFDGAPRSATATALSDCVLLPIDRNQISERLDKADPIIRALLEGQVRRYRGAIQAIRGVAARATPTEPDTPVGDLGRRQVPPRGAPARGAGGRGPRRALPADPARRQRPHRRLRGAGALEPSRARPDLAAASSSAWPRNRS